MKKILHQYDFVVIGGGLAGLTAAITAARNNLKTALVTDRPVLGGNASKEIQVSPHGLNYCGQNYVYGRETGFIEELLLENLKQNPFGNIEKWNITLVDCVKRQNNLSVFYNTSINNIHMSSRGKRILCIEGYSSLSEIWHTFNALNFADCTGDGSIGALAGAQFRIGCEKKSEFNETLAHDEAQDRVMGCSIQFRASDTGRKTDFHLPSWIKYRFSVEQLGPYRPIECFINNELTGFWWLEWGGFKDPINEITNIQDDLQQIAYALWDYIKNQSYLKDKLLTYELNWVSAIPGKRESRTFEGDYILTQNDIEQQCCFKDAVAYGGWGFDDHPPAGIFDKDYPSYHIYHKGPYNIPLRCLYSKNIANLFLAGRNISVSHVALTSTRIMYTCAQLGEAVGVCAAVCARHKVDPKNIYQSDLLNEVQKTLQILDHTIIFLPYKDNNNLANFADISVSSVLESPILIKSYGTWNMGSDFMAMFPINTNHIEEISILVDAETSTTLCYKIYSGPENDSTYPEKQIAEGSVKLKEGSCQWINLRLNLMVAHKGWHFLEVCKKTNIKIHYGNNAPVGLKSMWKKQKDPIRINNYSEWNFESTYDFKKYSACFQIKPVQQVYMKDNLNNGWSRPTGLPNLWISSPTDFIIPEWVELAWALPVEISEVHILFDSSLDCEISAFNNAYEEDVISSIIKDYRIYIMKPDEDVWTEGASVKGNFQRRRVHELPALIKRLRVEIAATNGMARAQIYSIRVY